MNSKGQEPPCTNQLCLHFRRQHGLMTERRNALEKELEAMRQRHDALYNQVVTRGEASMAREAATGEDGLRMPNGELMTAEKFMAKTRMMNQCMASLQASEKRAKQLAAENDRLKQERDSLYASMRKFEDRLNGFERERHYEVFTDDLHRETLKENDQLVDEIDELRCAERELREDNGVLRRRLAVYKARLREWHDRWRSLGLAHNNPNNKRRRQRRRGMLESEEEEEEEEGGGGNARPKSASFRSSPSASAASAASPSSSSLASIPIPRKRKADGDGASPTMKAARSRRSGAKGKRIESDTEEEEADKAGAEGANSE